MFVKNVYTFRNLPVEQKERKWTDCCCTIIGAIFALTLFIIACFSFNRDHFYQVNYPAESTGKLCYHNLADSPFIYFTNLDDPSQQRYCVAQCPQKGEQIQCDVTNNCSGIIASYDSRNTFHRLGGICEPTDSTLQDKLMKNPSINSKTSSVHGWQVAVIALAIGACVGLIYMIAVILIPKIMTYLAFVLCALVVLIAGILLIVQPVKLLAFHGNGWNIFIGIVLIILAIIMVLFLFCLRQEIELASIFLHYSNVFLKDKPILFAFIPLFMLFSFGLFVLCVWQYVAYGSINTPTWQKSHVYKQIDQNNFLQVLNFIQFVWGIQFIRDSFNYIISGNAVEWYFTYNNNEATQCSRPFHRYLCKNFGSVVGGSFLNAFFNLFGIVFDMFRCDPKGKCGRAQYCCKSVCCCCYSLFDLARADAYAYIHLSGIPYCNAARQCQAICEQTHLFASDDTCIRLYRLASQIFVVTLSVLITLILFEARTNYVSLLTLAVVICNCYLMGTHFVDIHSNGAQGLVTCYLAEANCEDNVLEVCPQPLRSDVYNFQEKHHLIDF